jgi:hypothetical protein
MSPFSRCCLSRCGCKPAAGHVAMV